MTKPNKKFNLKIDRRGRPKKYKFWSSVWFLLAITIIASLIILIADALYNRFILADHVESRMDTIEQVNKESDQRKSQELDNLEKEIENLKKANQDLNKKLESKIKDPGLFAKLSLIKKYFPEDTLIAISTFMAESGLRVDAINYNCYYGEISKSCNKGDEFTDKHWSTDCGLTQLSFRGQSCPKEAFNVEWNLQRARDKYDARKWQPWYAYTKGGYKAKLDQAKQYLALVN